jgi:hypothetical protein
MELCCRTTQRRCSNFRVITVRLYGFFWCEKKSVNWTTSKFTASRNFSWLELLVWMVLGTSGYFLPILALWYIQSLQMWFKMSVCCFEIVLALPDISTIPQWKALFKLLILVLPVVFVLLITVLFLVHPLLSMQEIAIFHITKEGMVENCLILITLTVLLRLTKSKSMDHKNGRWIFFNVCTCCQLVISRL